LAPSLRLSAPAHLYLDSLTLRGDPERADLSTDEDADRTDRLVNGELMVVVRNRLPVGAQLTLMLARDSSSLATSPVLILGPSEVASADVDADGWSTTPVESVLRFYLDESEIELFERDEVWVTEEIVLAGPVNGQPSRIAADDYIDWTAAATLTVRMGTRSSWEAAQ
jgi:hypothetical protein